MLLTVLLVGFVLVATVTDVRWHRVYNWTTYPGILIALGLNGLGDALSRWNLVDGGRLQAIGWQGLAQSAYGLLVCGGVMLVCFVLMRVGGGDVKLIAMMGAFLGPFQGLEAMLWTFVIGACAALIVVVWRVGPWTLLVRIMSQVLWWVRLGRANPIDPELRARLKPPLFLAPSALAAVVIVRFSLLGSTM